MTRIVLDTNVLASGFSSDANTARTLLDRWQDEEYELVVSEHLLAELARTFEGCVLPRSCEFATS